MSINASKQEKPFAVKAVKYLWVVFNCFEGLGVVASFWILLAHPSPSKDDSIVRFVAIAGMLVSIGATIVVAYVKDRVEHHYKYPA